MTWLPYPNTFMPAYRLFPIFQLLCNVNLTGLFTSFSGLLKIRREEQVAKKADPVPAVRTSDTMVMEAKKIRNYLFPSPKNTQSIQPLQQRGNLIQELQYRSQTAQYTGTFNAKQPQMSLIAVRVSPQQKTAHYLFNNVNMYTLRKAMQHIVFRILGK